MTPRPTIVVGLDHSPAGQAALLWADDEAARLHASVTVLRAFDLDQRAGLSRPTDMDSERRDCHHRAEQWVAETMQDRDPAAISVVTVPGSVEELLVEAGDDALIVVVGQPQDPRLAGLPEKLAHPCRCAVACIDANANAVFVTATSGE
jgi:nucleotide-binding universal stress UspA family protein